MPAIAQFKALLSLDTKAFRAGVKGAEGDTNRLKSTLASAGKMLGVAFGLEAVRRLGLAIVKAAAEMEDFREQFVALGISAAGAKAHMQDLAKFSAETPFALGDIANASQQLFALSEGVLGGVDSLKLFGDVAAATGNKDFAGFSYWVGRLYAALASGRPIIEAANALLRLKGIAPSTLKAMVEMEKSGKSSQEIWAAYVESLERFEGGLERLSKTASGKTSTMKDNWKIAMAEMGEAIEPVTKGLLNLLTLTAKAVHIIDPFSNVEKIAAGLGRMSAGDTFVETNEPSGVGKGVTMPEDAFDPAESLKEAEKITGKNADLMRRRLTGEAALTANHQEAMLDLARQYQRAQTDELRNALLDRGNLLDQYYNEDISKARAANAQKDDEIWASIDAAYRAYEEGSARLRDRAGRVGGRGVNQSSASGGAIFGGQRGGVALADRQLRLQAESVSIEKEIRDLARRRTEVIEAISEEISQRS